MNKGTFKKVNKTKKALFGPRAMLVCGFSSEEQQRFMQFLDIIDMGDVPVIFPTTGESETLLKDLLNQPGQAGRDLDSNMDRTIILSGVLENELHKTLSAYRDTPLPRPLWATLTAISQDWPLSALIEELKKERAAMEQRKRG